MKLTAKERLDLETIEYFIPRIWKGRPITDEDRREFMDFSTYGKRSERVDRYVNYDRLDEYDPVAALIQGKVWRGIHVGMYEEGVLDGSMPYMVLFDGAPRSVRIFMAREMFKGIDKELVLTIDTPGSML